jgi:hypothetical protein
VILLFILGLFIGVRTTDRGTTESDDLWTALVKQIKKNQGLGVSTKGKKL